MIQWIHLACCCGCYCRINHMETMSKSNNLYLQYGKLIIGAVSFQFILGVITILTAVLAPSCLGTSIWRFDLIE